ncbi:MAG: aminopeptidase [bacterium]
MKDSRLKKVAENLVSYSCKVKKGEKVLIETKDTVAKPLINALIDEIVSKGATPFVILHDEQIDRKLMINADEQWLEIQKEVDLLRMKQMDAYIAIRPKHNGFELTDVPAVQKGRYMEKYGKPVHLEERVRNTKWSLIAYPTPSYAQSSEMSTEQFEDFFFDVSTLDYSKMSEAMKPLKKLMEDTDRVRIKGPGVTDLSFSIKDLPAVPCAGEFNIPDGEVFTAPVRDSVNGVIEYNTPSAYQGTRFEKVKLTFKNGKIVEIEGDKKEALEEIFNTDEGARYVGEFAIGVNPFVRKPMVDILFDEKISGSIHFTPGAAYEDECDNGNRSAIHWDLVLMQTPDYGGGEIYFDDVLIRKDGLFVKEELKPLNPENLK